MFLSSVAPMPCSLLEAPISATERGWNLYVCGNGGMKPRHAELIASDLSRERLPRGGTRVQAPPRSVEPLPRAAPGDVRRIDDQDGFPHARRRHL